MIDWRSRAAERAATPTPAPFNAPLFRSLIEHLDEDRRWIVMDLGAAHTQTISLLGNFRCRLDIADLADGLETLRERDEETSLDEIAEELLPKPHGEPVDVILCWDLLNYMDRDTLRAIMGRVAARSHRGTLAHALIVYSETHMPSYPGHFVPQSDLSLLDLDARPADRAAPRYSPDDLGRCLPGYAIEKAMLLGNGMQEFLFRL